MTASQVAANYLLGPCRPPNPPGAIAFATVSNVTMEAGITLALTISAADPNMPALPIVFDLLASPAGAAVGPVSGIFTWRPATAQADSTNLISIRAANNATPPLTATQQFLVIVKPLAAPAISANPICSSSSAPKPSAN